MFDQKHSKLLNSLGSGVTCAPLNLKALNLKLVAKFSLTRLNQVKCAVDALRETAANRTGKLQQEMSIIQENTCSVKSEWISYIKSAESHYLEDTSSVEGGKEDMEGILHNWLTSFGYRYLSSLGAYTLWHTIHIMNWK